MPPLRTRPPAVVPKGYTRVRQNPEVHNGAFDVYLSPDELHEIHVSTMRTGTVTDWRRKALNKPWEYKGMRPLPGEKKKKGK